LAIGLAAGCEVVVFVITWPPQPQQIAATVAAAIHQDARNLKLSVLVFPWCAIPPPKICGTNYCGRAM
jgi:hypothetical protein